MQASSKPLALLFGMRKKDDVLAFVGRNGYVEWTWQPDLLMQIRLRISLIILKPIYGICWNKRI
jgi:hypothetical protein